METLHLLELNLGRNPMRIRVLVAEIPDELILYLGILHICDVLVDLRLHTLRLRREELSLWSPMAWPRSSQLMMNGYHLIPS
jgi:hypothetical protein